MLKRHLECEFRVSLFFSSQSSLLCHNRVVLRDT
nr:MAG TPA: hypothetical protein [Caudoviricetes sp.]